MKIGLLTYHHSMNYGAVLQTYATCRVLKELGHEVELIDFRHPEKASNWSLPFYFKVKAFNRFKSLHYAPYSKYIDTIEQLRLRRFDYDCIMVGSDQTWNPNISREKRLAYFLSFGSDECKRISFASSFGVSAWPEKYFEDIPLIRKALESFSAISVREKTGQLLLKETFGVDSTVVLDPTLFHKDYKELIGEVKETEDVICCLLHRPEKQLKKVRELDAYLHTKGKVISTIWPVRGLNYVYPPSIESWLKYIAGAKFVVTDSFHGVAFSLVFNREFVVITPDIGKNSRLKDLMDTLGLSNRYYYDTDVIDYEKLISSKIDYQKVNELLQREREYSWRFLKDNLI